MCEQSKFLLSRIITCFLGLVVFSACSSESRIIINNNLSGQAEIEIEVSDVLLRYYQDITGDYNSNTLFTPDEIRFQLEQRQAVEVSHMSLSDSLSLEIGLSFGNINELLRREFLAEGLAGSSEIHYEDFIIMEDLARYKKLTLNLSESNIRALLSLGVVGGNTVGAYLLPSPQNKIEPDDYRDDLLWALEEYEDPIRLKKLINTSHISFIIFLPREPVEVFGGRPLSRKELLENSEETEASFGVVFTVSIIAFLTMSTQDKFFVIY